MDPGEAIVKIVSVLTYLGVLGYMLWHFDANPELCEDGEKRRYTSERVVQLVVVPVLLGIGAAVILFVLFVAGVIYFGAVALFGE